MRRTSRVCSGTGHGHVALDELLKLQEEDLAELLKLQEKDTLYHNVISGNDIFVCLL